MRINEQANQIAHTSGRLSTQRLAAAARPALGANSSKGQTPCRACHADYNVPPYANSNNGRAAIGQRDN